MKLEELFTIIENRKKDLPKNSYVATLFTEGKYTILQKIGEETTELLLATKKEEIIWEATDLLFHMLVLLSNTGISLQDIEVELGRRNKMARKTVQDQNKNTKNRYGKNSASATGNFNANKKR